MCLFMNLAYNLECPFKSYGSMFTTPILSSSPSAYLTYNFLSIVQSSEYLSSSLNFCLLEADGNTSLSLKSDRWHFFSLWILKIVSASLKFKHFRNAYWPSLEVLGGMSPITGWSLIILASRITANLLKY